MKKKLCFKRLELRFRLLYFAVLMSSFGLLAQTGARITEVVPNSDQVTLTNFEGTSLDVSAYWLCLGPGNYANVGALNGGSAIIPSGGTLALTFNVDPVSDGLSLFSTNSFGSSDPDILLDFVQWGAANQPRSGQAVTAGRWDDASRFINCPAPYATSSGGSVEAWISSVVYAPAISFDGDETSVSICVDGNADPLNVNRETGAIGTNAGWIITDQNTGQILGLPAAPPFNLDGAGVGVCDIWYIRYEDGLSGLEVGTGIDELSGCFDLSNSIEVIREEANAGVIGIDVDATTTANQGGTLRIDSDFEVSICVDGSADPIVVFHNTPSVNLTYRYVITDVTTDTILGFSNANEISLDGAGVGVCAIWGWSYRGLNQDDFIGEPLQALRDADCSDISVDSIVVTREEANAGTIGVDVIATNDANENGTLRIDGEFEISLCVDGSADPIIVFHETPSENLTYKYVITDVNTGNILGFADTNEINLDGAGAGVCAIWGWSYRGLNQDDFIGEPLQALRDADCSDISEDSIVVNRLEGEDCNVLAIGDLETTDFSLFPNPAENSVNISLNTNEAVTAQINIYDVAGRLVVQQQMQTQTTLDVSRLQSGTYLVHLIDSATGSTTTKQMIKR